ncbi:hypothetical protein GQX73_g871 [Xylaria multiplex]|uniref:Heterokaryon incompatibility domain-containing protein n=1 Tax=Xylaria multiplex TaxID=323545 RepID=A0A7C8IUK0_9PEZI|nr:hypothetical protein GQX73_g871 [Xylaria multiplex]
MRVPTYVEFAFSHHIIIHYQMAEAQEKSVCRDCLELFKDAALHLSPEPPKEASVRLFNTRYRKGAAANISALECPMCTLFYSSVPRLKQTDGGKKEILALAVAKTRHDPHSVTASIVGFESESPSLQTRYRGTLRIQDVQQGLVRTLTSPQTLSQEALDSIQFWMKSCASSHAKCEFAKYVKRLPLRLVDVMPTGFNHKTYTGGSQVLRLEETAGVRIVSSENLPLNTPYLTLSHRWASPPVILLSTATLFLLQGDITPYLLRHSETAAFRHAVYITRGLGYRYIWIDALCIMQDDESEKTAEIMQMDEIYSNSTLNIAASEGRIHEGLLFNRKLEDINPCIATVRISKGQVAHLLAFSDKCSSTEASLNGRGWVFQERILSPRICHFTKNQIFWECRSLEASEVLPRGVPDRALRSFGLGIDIPASMDQPKRRWYELAEQYSRTSLTFPNDRLLAISAVAKRFCLAMKLHPSDYLAGMWKNDLPQSLLWFQRTADDHELSAEKHVIDTDEMEFTCAPTWSWASILSSSSHVETASQTVKSTLLDVSISRISSNFFDGTTSCRLRLQGPLCKCRRQVSGGTPWIHVGQHTRFQEAKDFMFQHGDTIILNWDISRKKVADFLEAGASSFTPYIFFLLHIASEKSEEGPIERGIILRKTDSHGTYVRVGSFMTTPLESTYPGSELEAAFNGVLETLGIDDYIVLGADGQRTIDIV